MWNRAATHIKHKSITLLLTAVVFSVVPLLAAVQSAAADTATSIYLSPSTQTVTTGDDLTVNIVINPGDDSINTFQTDFTYSPSNFNLVSFTNGTAFPNFATGPTETSGSIAFTSFVTGAVSTTETVATVVLQATGTGVSAVNLGTVCGSGVFNDPTCSYALDSTTNDNDLGTVTDGSYTINATPAVSSSSTSGSSTSSTTSSLKAPDTGLALIAAHPATTLVLSATAASTLLLIAYRLKPRTRG